MKKEGAAKTTTRSRTTTTKIKDDEDDSVVGGSKRKKKGQGGRSKSSAVDSGGSPIILAGCIKLNMTQKTIDACRAEYEASDGNGFVVREDPAYWDEVHQEWLKSGNGFQRRNVLSHEFNSYLPHLVDEFLERLAARNPDFVLGEAFNL